MYIVSLYAIGIMVMYHGASKIKQYYIYEDVVFLRKFLVNTYAFLV